MQLIYFKQISIQYKSSKIDVDDLVRLSSIYVFIQINICSHIKCKFPMKKKTVIEGAFFFHLQSFLILHIHCSLWSHYLASLYSIQLYVSDLSSSNCIHSIKIGKSITVRRLTATVYEGFDSIL